MGKQLSKGNVRSSTRRQRSQIMSQPTVVASPDPPRIAPETTDRAILTLKLQRDELTVYKGRLNALLRKEDDTVRRLLKEGKTERAKLLLQKKRLQEHILQETEKQLNSILNQASTQTALEGIRKDVDHTIDQNSEAMKRLHNLLSLEHAELMLRETVEGSKKQSEVDQLLLLATQGEREFLQKDVEIEMQKLTTALGIASKEHKDSVEVAGGEEVNELEALAAKKLKETEEEQEIGDVIEDKPEEKTALQVPTVVVDGVVSNTVSTMSETTASAADADDEKSSSSEDSTDAQPGQESVEVTSSIFPDVPSHSIDNVNYDEVEEAQEKQKVLQPEAVIVANAKNP